MFAALALAAAGCERSAPPPPADVPPPAAAGAPWFREVAREAGVDFRCESGHEGRHLFPEIILGGCALFDMDGDDDLDLYLVQGGRDPRPPNRLYRNDGAVHFVDVTEGSGADDRGYGIGVAAGDCDDDGDTDLYVTNVGPDVLLRNDGGGKFADVTAASGTGDPGWGTSAAFLDYDADGDLDLFVVDYVVWSADGELDCRNAFGALDYCLPTSYEAPAGSVLYRNEGNGKFRDVSRAAGIRASLGNGLGIRCGDFDGDGRIDVFVANDTMQNLLWMNRGDGTFVDEGLLRGCALDENGVAKAGMGVASADLDDDADLDLLVVNLEGESDSFYLNEGGFFFDRTAAFGLAVASRRYTRFGVGFVDFDNDGNLDLYQANGRVQMAPEPIAADPYAEPNLLLRGTGDGRFEPVSPPGGTAEPLVATSRGAAFGDLDGNGGVDVVVVNRDGPVHVLLNTVPDRGGWIRLRVLERSGRDALGAVVMGTVGGRRVTRDVASGWSYASANDPAVHLGLGAETRVSGVTVRWADGVEEAFGDHEAGRTVVLRRGAGGR
jgi:hypothetical protein